MLSSGSLFERIASVNETLFHVEIRMAALNDQNGTRRDTPEVCVQRSTQRQICRVETTRRVLVVFIRPTSPIG